MTRSLRPLRLLVVASTLLVLAGTTGCRTLRFDVGIGFGFGVSLKVPALAHVGAEFGGFYHLGHCYSEGWRAGADPLEIDHSANFFGLVHTEFLADKVVLFSTSSTKYTTTYTYHAHTRQEKHLCTGLLPILVAPEDPETYALEITVKALLLDVVIGFNPYYLFHRR